MSWVEVKERGKVTYNKLPAMRGIERFVLRNASIRSKRLYQRDPCGRHHSAIHKILDFGLAVLSLEYRRKQETIDEDGTNRMHHQLDKRTKAGTTYKQK